MWWRWWQARGRRRRRKKCRRKQGRAKSPRQAEDKKKRAVQLFRRFCVDAANHTSDAVTAQRDHLVCHDLRSKAKTVPRRNFDQRPEQKSILQVRRNGADENRQEASGELVCLNDNARPWPPEITRNDHQHDIAARYFHDSQS